MNNSYKYIDLSYLQTAFHDDKAMISQLINIFEEELPSIIETLELALEQSNYELLWKTAHRFKINVKILGMHKLHDNLQNLEIKAKKNIEHNTYKMDVENFKTDIKTALVELEKFSNS